MTKKKKRIPRKRKKLSSSSSSEKKRFEKFLEIVTDARGEKAKKLIDFHLS